MNQVRIFAFKSLFLFSLFISGHSDANTIRLGGMMGSHTGGRVVPGLYAAFEGKSMGVSFSSLGYKNSVNYLTAYTANWFYNFRPGKLFSGELVASIGLGASYHRIGSRDSLAGNGVRRDNGTFGPMIRSFWGPFWPIYIGIEAMFGIRPNFITNHIFLSSQDIAILSVGIFF